MCLYTIVCAYKNGFVREADSSVVISIDFPDEKTFSPVLPSENVYKFCRSKDMYLSSPCQYLEFIPDTEVMCAVKWVCSKVSIVNREPGTGGFFHWNLDCNTSAKT